MARRKLSERELNLLRWANRAGYKSYRYGSTKPVSLPRVFTGEARKAKVDAVMDVLRDWRLSPFEHEGSARAGIRAGLCLAGYKGKSIGWHQADFEAECLVGEALKLMGAKRPTLLEGQRQYSTERENCQWCSGPLDDEDRSNHRRFCSDECGRAARTHNLPFFQTVTGIMRTAAAYVVAKEMQPEQQCQWCRKRFKPAGLLLRTKTVTCSPECNRAYMGAMMGQKTCLQCKKLFTPGWINNTKFCSDDCQKTHRNERRRAETDERHVSTPCEFCGESFVPKKVGTRFCGHRCAWKSRLERKKERNGERDCMECGTAFKPARPEAKCCSPGCASLFRTRVAGEKKKASTFTCEECPPVRKAD